MGYRRELFGPGEWYHCYTRGIDGRITFEIQDDYRRFVQALYLSNSAETIERGRFQRLDHEEIFNLPRGARLVGVGAYALMPNHIHLFLKEIEEGGISKFMQRLGTSYTMYYNTRYKHIGNLFVKPFRSRHVATDGYLKRIVSYIHLNPCSLYEYGWKAGQVNNMDGLREFLEYYPYSSMTDYQGARRPENALLDWGEINELLREQTLPLETLLPEMAEYYAQLDLDDV